MEKKYPTTFDDLLFGNEFDQEGLLAEVTPVAPSKSTAEHSAVRSAFAEIVAFREKTGHAPELNSKNIQEKLLAKRLDQYCQNASKSSAVKDMDHYGLLTLVGEAHPKEKPPTIVEPKSFDDLLSMDDDLLSDIDASIFNVEHVEKTPPRELEDPLARRKPCEDFYRYEKLFADMQRMIRDKEVQITRFKNESQVGIGDFFILGGVLCYVDSILEEKEDPKNPRYRVIFENGAESNHLRFSFTRALYRDETGRRIIPNAEMITQKMQGLKPTDQPTGCVYILGSDSKAPALAPYQARGQLVKIGYSTQKVEERIKNAERDPTYLEAPVRVLAVLDCFNLNPQKFEHLIHAFLAKQRLNLTMMSAKGQVYHPSEWFTIDRDTAIQVATHIINGDIMKYRMDNTTNQLKAKG